MISQPKRLLLVPTKAKIGLSSIVKGLVVSLRELGISLRVDLLSDSLLEATHIRRTSGRVCQCLAPTILTKEQIQFGYEISLNSCELHILVCEDLKFLEENKDLFEQIDPVVILLFDSEEEMQGDFLNIFKIAESLNRYDKIGLIGNFTSSNNDLFDKLNQNEKIKLLGLIPKFEEGRFAGNSSLSVNRNPSLLTRNQILRLKNLVEDYINFNEFRELYKQSREINFPKTNFAPKCRIAVADDSAFHLSFQDNLSLLREFGAEIKLFSPLAEQVLPENIDAIYFPNSYINLYSEELENNKKLISNIREAIYSGVLAYFEGDSLAYACKRIIFENGSSSGMLEILNADANYYYQEVDNYNIQELEASSVSVITEDKEKCKAFINQKIKIHNAGEFRKVFNHSDLATAGISVLSNVFCSSSIFHWGSNRDIAKNFVNNAITVGRSEYSSKK